MNDKNYLVRKNNEKEYDIFKDKVNNEFNTN